MAIDPKVGEQILAENFAPWILALGLSVTETGDRHAVLRLPLSDQLAREGGALCGQALMAAADTAAVIALCSARDGYTPLTTVQQSATFQRAVLGADVLVTAVVSKLGRRIAFVEVTMAPAGQPEAGVGAEVGAEPEPAARASSVYAFAG